MIAIIEQQMEKDDETTATQLNMAFLFPYQQYFVIKVNQVGGSAYCQLPK